MRIVLWIFSLLSVLSGIAILFGAKSAIHEIEAFLLFIIASILISGAVVSSTIIKSKSSDKTTI